MSTQGVWADPTVTIIKKLNGSAATTASPGEVSSIISNGECTLAIIPTEGNYVTNEFITVYSTVMGNVAQARMKVPNVDVTPIEVNPKDSNADPTGETQYTFTMPADGSDVEVTINFQTRKDISNATIDYIEDQTYTGSAINPTLTIKDGQTTLVLNIDYTVEYTDNINAGTATATITGKGIYTGTATKTYQIVVTTAVLTTLPTAKKLTYTGEAQELVSAGEATGGSLLYSLDGNIYSTEIPTGIDAKDYIVYYKVVGDDYHNDIDAATTIVTITAKALTDAMVTLSATTLTYNGNVQKPTVTVTDRNTALKEGTDYTLTNDGGTAVGTYNVSVTGKGNYAGEITKNFTISANSTTLNVTLGTTSYTYDGTAKQPEVNIKAGETTLVATDYDVAYANNINAGTATVSVTGKGNYAGSTGSATFTITAKALTDAMVTLSATTFTYNGNVQKPTVTVTDGNTVLKEGTDYTLTNDGGTAVGTYNVSVTGKGNYAGEITKNFTISANSTTLNVTLGTTSYTYDGTAKQPEVNIKAGETTLVATDYDVAYANNINAGTATVSVTGKGNYAGSTGSATFTITAKALTDAMVTLSATTFTYNGNVQKPTVTVTDRNTALKEGTDYTLTNDGGTAVGTYNVVVNGKGNYAGEITKLFSITIETYGIWIGNIEVNADNKNDILEDADTENNQAASFSYNPNNNTLIINADVNTSIKASKELTIYLAPKSHSYIRAINYTGQESARLIFTTDGNFPGKLTLLTNSGNVINGFSELHLDQNLGIINDLSQELTYADKTLASKNATIGICINPLVEEKIVTPTEDKFTEKNGEDVDLRNTVIDDILYTLNVSNDDGYNTEDNSIHLNTVMSDNEVEQAIKHTPGSENYSELFTGMTFIVPAGEGLIRINAQVESGYVIKVKIGNNPAQEFTSLSFNNPIPYNVEDPTFVYIYNGGQNISGARNKAIKPGRRKVTHIKVFNVTISPQTVKAASPVGNVSGGEYKGEIPPVGQNMTEPDIIESGISTVRADIDTRNGKWYNLNGQQIDEPKQKGLYIHNGQKVYIK